MAIVIGTVINQTVVNNGPAYIVVSIQNYCEPTVTLGGYAESGVSIPWPKTAGGNEIVANQTVTCFVTAQLVTAGSLLAIEGAGGLPVNSNGFLLTENATIVDADLFE